MATDFTERVDLAAERTGGSVVYANDEFFASKDNLLKPTRAVWREGEYTDRGKWMDGWESRRRREPGHDFCIVRLGLPGVVRGVVVDTAFFRGNFPESCSIDVAHVPGHPDTATLLSDATQWVEVLPRTKLAGDSENLFAIDAALRATHVRMHIYPDGGVARLRVHGDVVPAPRVFSRGEVDLASVENGARVVACNDMFFGSRHNLIMPGRGANMGDGWETKRGRREGPDWVVVQLAARGAVEHLEVDTTHFRGNAPESCAIDVCDAAEGASPEAYAWRELLARTKLQPHTRHFFESEIAPDAGAATHARLRIWPDGGVSRLRLYGRVERETVGSIGARRLDLLPRDQLEAELRACCGSSAWVRAMADARPYGSPRRVIELAEQAAAGMTRDDWLETFRAHPRIGERKPAVATGAQSSRWSAQEQASLATAAAASLDSLATANAAYEARFGHIYIVCASGRSADEMLALATERLANAPDRELAVASGEQRRITALRLTQLLVNGR